jgi:hypothetical protein
VTTPEDVPDTPVGVLLPLLPDEVTSPQLLPGQCVGAWVVRVCLESPTPEPGQVWIYAHDTGPGQCSCGRPWCLELLVQVEALRKRAKRTGQ